MAPGGTIANVGVHGSKVDLHLERLWSQNITITTRLVDTVTTPMLLKTVQSGKIDPEATDHPPLQLGASSMPMTRSAMRQHPGAESDHRSLIAAHLPSPRRIGDGLSVSGLGPRGVAGYGRLLTTRGPFQILTAGISW